MRPEFLLVTVEYNGCDGSVTGAGAPLIGDDTDPSGKLEAGENPTVAVPGADVPPALLAVTVNDSEPVPAAFIPVLPAAVSDTCPEPAPPLGAIVNHVGWLGLVAVIAHDVGTLVAGISGGSAIGGVAAIGVVSAVSVVLVTIGTGVTAACPKRLGEPTKRRENVDNLTYPNIPFVDRALIQRR